MTSNEILKADVLDIVFDNRNKNYGAYVLRKYYNNRLLIAMSGMLGIVLVLVLITVLNPKVRQTIEDAIQNDGTVIVRTIPNETPPPQVPVKSTPPQARQVTSSSQILITNETNMHTQEEIESAIVSNKDVEGPALDNGLQPHIESSAPATPPPAVESTPPTPPAPSSAAAFPGGQEKWMEFLSRNLRTPSELEAGQKRNVMVRFTVGEDGSVTQFEIVQSGGEAFDREVIRVLKKMPKWKPAIQNGRPVSVLFTQPVTFLAVEE